MDEWPQHLYESSDVQQSLQALQDFTFSTQKTMDRVLEEVRRTSESFQMTLVDLNRTLDIFVDNTEARFADGTIEGDFYRLHRPQDPHYMDAIERTAARFSQRWRLRDRYIMHALAQQAHDQQMSRSRLKRQLLTTSLVLAVEDAKRDRLNWFWAQTFPPRVVKRDIALDLAWRKYMHWLEVRTIHLAEQDLLAMMPASFALTAKRAREDGQRRRTSEMRRASKNV